MRDIIMGIYRWGEIGFAPILQSQVAFTKKSSLGINKWKDFGKLQNEKYQISGRIYLIQLSRNPAVAKSNCLDITWKSFREELGETTWVWTQVTGVEFFADWLSEGSLLELEFTTKGAVGIRNSISCLTKV